MEKKMKMAKTLGTVIVSAALKVGIASSNSACRWGFYQNKVPESMAKFKKKAKK